MITGLLPSPSRMLALLSSQRRLTQRMGAISQQCDHDQPHDPQRGKLPAAVRIAEKEPAAPSP